jgi:hypothetical protein
MLRSVFVFVTLSFVYSNVDILEKYQNSAYMSNLPNILEQCKTSESRSPDCNLAEYLNEISILNKKLSSRPRGYDKHTVPQIHSSDGNYRTLFENFIHTNK